MRRTAALVVAVLVATPLLFGSAAGAQQTESGVDCTYPLGGVDASGTEVTVDDQPLRVVVLAPSAAQTMWAIGAQDMVVGMPVNRFTAYLDGRDDKTNVVNEQGQPIKEAVVATNPDLVLAPNIITDDTVAKLRDSLSDDAAVYRFRAANSLADVAAKTELTGRLVGSFDSAAEVAAEFRGHVAAVEEATADRERPTVYYALGGGWTAGTETFIGELIDKAGGRNIAGAANITGYATISQEVIAAEDPDWIVVSEGMPVPDTSAVQGSTAVEEGNVLEVDSNFINQPAPRVTVPLEAMAKAFHGDAVTDATFENVETPAPTRCNADVTPTPTPTTTSTPEPVTSTTEPTTDEPTTTSTPTPTPTPTATPTPTEGDGPGFGLTAAALALVAAAGLLTRRD